ncbi:MAG: hypothetical protein J0H39_00015 [Alphaproteobacteria bacterium]|nr:hypothetical protein [Alphaproteobacteria bacterium]
MINLFSNIDYDATAYEDDNDLVDHVCRIYPPQDQEDWQIIKLTEKLQKLAVDRGFGYHTVYRLNDAGRPALQFEFEAPVAADFIAASHGEISGIIKKLERSGKFGRRGA